MDKPDGIRKHHKSITPRTGGIALFASFFITLVLVIFIQTRMIGLMQIATKYWLLAGAGMIVFAAGLWDDYSRLHYRIKFSVQIVAASMVYMSGFGINDIAGFKLIPLVGYCLTIFWILLFINAINLLDGLDGLSSGVCLICSLTMLFLSIANGDMITSIPLSCLSGTLIGFLRYNFSPASIFMGDGGSYFLGYSVAVISLCNSVTTETGTPLLIPVLAMGVPMFDTFLSPVRRFLTGKGPFKPDTGHVHHMMVNRLGLNARKTVLVIYLITCCLCVTSLIVVITRSELGTLSPIVMSACAILFIEKLGYLDAFESKRIVSWIRDIWYVTGLSKQRRIFLHLQLNISNSRNNKECWENVSAVVNFLNFDYAELNNETSDGKKVIEIWRKEHFELQGNSHPQYLMKFELPLIDDNGFDYGTLLLIKDVRQTAVSRFTFLKIDQLRRTLKNRLKLLKDMQNDNKQTIPVIVNSQKVVTE